VVTICTASLTFSNSTFCPHTVFMCFVWISEQTAIISLYNINRNVFITDTECLLRGTDYRFKTNQTSDAINVSERGCSDVNSIASSHTHKPSLSTLNFQRLFLPLQLVLQSMGGHCVSGEISKWLDHTGRALEDLTVKRSGEAHWADHVTWCQLEMAAQNQGD